MAASRIEPELLEVAPTIRPKHRQDSWIVLFVLVVAGVPPAKSAATASSTGQNGFTMSMNADTLRAENQLGGRLTFPDVQASQANAPAGHSTAGSSPDRAAQESSLSNDELDRIAAKVTVSAEDKVIAFVDFMKGTLITGVLAVLGIASTIIYTFGKRVIASIVDERVRTEMQSLETARQAAISAATSAKDQLSKLASATDDLRKAEEKLELDFGRIEIDGRRLQAELKDVRSGLNEEILDSADQLRPTLEVLGMVLQEIASFTDARSKVLGQLESRLRSSQSSDEVRRSAALHIQELQDFEPALKILIESLGSAELQSVSDTLLTAIGGAVKGARKPMSPGFRETALSVLPLLEAILKEPEHPNIEAAIGTLGDYSDTVDQPETVVGWLVDLTEKLPPLDPRITLQESTDPEFATVHKAIPLAFAAYGENSEPAVPWLRKMLVAHVPDVRRNAAIALGDIGAGAVESLPDLGRRARDRQEISDVSHACGEAINKIKGGDE